MIERMKSLWAERSPREQWLLGIMAALFALVVLWLGIITPLQAAQRSTRDALAQATDTNANIRAKVKLLKSLPRGSAVTASSAPVDQLVGQAAGEAGLTLERAQAQGADRVEIAIASVRPVALFSWIAALEAQGIRVDTISARPSATAGSLTVQAIMMRGGGQ